MTIVDIAKICHEANRAICEAAGDHSQKPWNDVEQWQRDSAIRGVEYRMNNPQATPADMHNEWKRCKIAEGWVYGAEKDPEKKTHPCLVEYDQLPFEQRVKDYVFLSLVESLLGSPMR